MPLLEILYAFVPLEHKKLPCLYSGATVFVLPSHCQSFGIPLLEAMACGVPIVTSNVSAMPEVAGNAALLANPYNFREIAEAIYKLLINFNLRQEFIKRGYQRVKKFSWQEAARKTLAVYEEVYRS